jgi:tetratricopeptide (TPR) repeat protein
MHAFKRAQKHREADISYAHHLRDTARSIQSFGKEITTAKRNAFCSAAEAFLRCAQCAKDKEQRVFFHNAADCFQNAGSYSEHMEDYVKAARAYENAKEYTPAVRLYRKTDV